MSRQPWWFWLLIAFAVVLGVIECARGSMAGQG